MDSFFANATSGATSVSATFSRPFSRAVPPLPGATNTFCTRGLCASFQARACSRPPEPMTKSFISVAEVAHAREYHGHAALVGRCDHLSVAHAAAGLDDRLGAGLGQRVQAVAEREEGIGGDDRAFQGQAGGRRLHGGDAYAVDAAHLSGADAEGRAGTGENDRIRLHVLRHAPGKKEVLPLRLARGTARHYSEF